MHPGSLDLTHSDLQISAYEECHNYLDPELASTAMCAFTVKGFAPGFGLAIATDSKIAVTVTQIPMANLMLISPLTESY